MADNPFAATLGDAILDTVVFRGEVTLVTSRERLVEVLAHLRDAEKFEMLTDATCVDFYPEEPRFALVYQLTSLERATRARVKVMLSENDRSAPTVSGVYPNANWLEREMYDLFGIRFEGHPDLRRILLPADYQGHPLLKEVPVTVEEVAFSFNQRRINENKIFAGQ